MTPSDFGPRLGGPGSAPAPAPLPAYRDPWLTQGWFARLVTDQQPERPSDFRSAGNPLAILAILAAQAVLSARFLSAFTGAPSEGLALWTGYLQVHHLITLSQLQGLTGAFGGSPEIYPPAGSLAATAGGLSGARQLSLAFTLFATCMLYGVARRLWSSRLPAIFGAALFAGLGSVQFLGSLATGDAMALALLALAAWLGVYSASAQGPARLGLLAAAGICLIAANAVLYTTVFYDSFVILVSALAVRRMTTGLGTAFGLLAFTAVLAAGGYEAAGPQYRTAVSSAVKVRVIGTSSASHVLSAGGLWLGILLCAAVVGAFAVTLRRRSAEAALLSWLLVVAALLPLGLAAREHATVSLYPEAALGAWFGCVVAGWALAFFFDVGKRGGKGEAPRPSRLAGRGAAFAAVAASAAIGALTAVTQFHSWPDSTAAASELTTLLTSNGAYLAEAYGQFAYSERARVSFAQWSGTAAPYSYLDPGTKRRLSGTAAYTAAIKNRYFSVIVLDGQETPSTDQAIERAIRKYGDYRQVASIPFVTSSGPGRYLFWVPVS